MLTSDRTAVDAKLADAAGTFVPHPSDERIASQAIGALRREKLLPGLRIELSVDRGWLTISGRAAHPVERSAAECVVRCVPGVRGVTNRLVVTLADL